MIYCCKTDNKRELRVCVCLYLWISANSQNCTVCFSSRTIRPEPLGRRQNGYLCPRTYLRHTTEKSNKKKRCVMGGIRIAFPQKNKKVHHGASADRSGKCWASREETVAARRFAFHRITNSLFLKNKLVSAVNCLNILFTARSLLVA